MIRLHKSVIEGIRAADTPAKLHRYLQNAIELEHSTIPPYLTAMLSLRAGRNRRIAELIRRIVIEEMLHMSIAANILIAIGGRPQINTPQFVPDYPGPLPMQIGDGLIVGIEAFSMPLVRNVFMAIEQPENEIPVRALEGAEDEPEYATIGQFYDAIQEQIRALGDSIFVQPTAPPQVVAPHWFPPDKLYPIIDVETACAAIDLIKIEGEGTSTSPFQSPGDPAHFYQFGSIVHGREIVRVPGKPGEPDSFAYAGMAIPFDPDGIWPLLPNCKIADFKPGTQARVRIEQYAYSYSSLLNALHIAFNGEPEKLDAAIGLMYDLRVLAVALMQTVADPKTGRTVGPSYEYVRVQGGIATEAAA